MASVFGADYPFILVLITLPWLSDIVLWWVVHRDGIQAVALFRCIQTKRRTCGMYLIWSLRVTV